MSVGCARWRWSLPVQVRVIRECLGTWKGGKGGLGVGLCFVWTGFGSGTGGDFLYGSSGGGSGGCDG